MREPRAAYVLDDAVARFGRGPRLLPPGRQRTDVVPPVAQGRQQALVGLDCECVLPVPGFVARAARNQAFRSEEHTSELQSLMRISYAVFCLKKKKQNIETTQY